MQRAEQQPFLELDRAIIQQAIEDMMYCRLVRSDGEWRSPDSETYCNFMDAVGWMFADEGGDHLFAFARVCDRLGVKAKEIRQGVLVKLQEKYPDRVEHIRPVLERWKI